MSSFPFAKKKKAINWADEDSDDDAAAASEGANDDDDDDEDDDDVEEEEEEEDDDDDDDRALSLSEICRLVLPPTELAGLASTLKRSADAIGIKDDCVADVSYDRRRHLSQIVATLVSCPTSATSPRPARVTPRLFLDWSETTVGASPSRTTATRSLEKKY